MRKEISSYLKERDCATLIRPVEDEKQLQQLNSLDEDELRPEFISQVNALRKKIFSNIKPKAIQGTLLNGDLLVSFCRHYIKLINGGSVPIISNTWDYVCIDQSNKAIKEAYDFIERNIEKLVGPLTLA